MKHPSFVAFCISVFCVPALCVVASADDWPQWRGPDRTGVVPSSPPLADAWPEEGPAMLWESEFLPSRDDGGLGSIVVADGRAYLFVNWREDQPVPTRTITNRELNELGQPDKRMPPEVLAKVEAARTSEERAKQRGSRIRKWAEDWANEHLGDDDELKRYRNWARQRLEEGDQAVPLTVFDTLEQVRNKPFDDDAALTKWLNEHEVPAAAQAKLLNVIVKTVKVADDHVICLNAATGETLWKKSFDGKPYGSRASSTPCVTNGRLFIAGSTHALCLNATSGELIWKAELQGRGSASSFLVDDGKAVVFDRHLTAFDASTGDELWRAEKVQGSESSPAVFEAGDRKFIVANTSRNEVACVSLADGQVQWTAPGGGIASPVVVGDVMVILSKSEDLGLAAYRVSPTSATQLWSHPLNSRGAATPAVHDGHVYLLGGKRRMCVRLSDGAVQWKEDARAEITSPVLADGKLFNLEGNGQHIVMLKADPAGHVELGSARIKAAWCPSPTVADGKLFVRMSDSVRCYGLKK